MSLKIKADSNDIVVVIGMSETIWYIVYNRMGRIQGDIQTHASVIKGEKWNHLIPWDWFTPFTRYSLATPHSVKAQTSAVYLLIVCDVRNTGPSISDEVKQVNHSDRWCNHSRRKKRGHSIGALLYFIKYVFEKVLHTHASSFLLHGKRELMKYLKCSTPFGTFVSIASGWVEPEDVTSEEEAWYHDQHQWCWSTAVHSLTSAKIKRAKLGSKRLVQYCTWTWRQATQHCSLQTVFHSRLITILYSLSTCSVVHTVPGQNWYTEQGRPSHIL